jgi:hypothetical protein
MAASEPLGEIIGEVEGSLDKLTLQNQSILKTPFEHPASLALTSSPADNLNAPPDLGGRAALQGRVKIIYFHVFPTDSVLAKPFHG